MDLSMDISMDIPMDIHEKNLWIWMGNCISTASLIIYLKTHFAAGFRLYLGL